MIVALNNVLAGWPDLALSALLIGIGAMLIVVAIVAPRVVKLPFALWAVL